jgi:hypothetical protein
MTRHSTLSGVAALALVVGLAGGCASTQDLERVEGLAMQAQSMARDAQASADRANQTADAALQTAEGAQACCDANTERMDRMFRKSMYK